jgi:hypothetical protein
MICFIVSASLSAVAAQLLSEYDSYINTTVTIVIGYGIYFGIFSCLFYMDNKKRYKQMEKNLIKKEIFNIISSFGLGEIVYLVIRWPTLYYFLEIQIEPFVASIISEIIATICYMISVTIFLRKSNTF